MKVNQKEKRLLEDVVMIVAATTMMMIVNGYFSPSRSFDPYSGLLMLLVSYGANTIAVIDIGLVLSGKTFPTLNLKWFHRNKRGIVWVWAVAAITIGFTALAWFVVSWPLYMIMDAVEASYTYPPETLGTINLVKMVITWFLAIEIFGVVIWALVSSYRREDQTYPVG